jgi:hypothetical protein
MKLVLVGQGVWTVYAICTDETTCPLLDFVAELDEKRAAKVLSDLKQFVPNSQPADWVRIDFSWKLRGTDAILEFRWPARKGGTPRVLWFYDEGRVVVCSHGLDKKGTELDPAEIQAAEAAKARYLKAKALRQLEVVRHEDFDPPDDEEDDDEDDEHEHEQEN